MEHCMRIVIIRVDSRVRNVHTELHDFRDLDKGFMRDFVLAPWYEH
jgi:hypothetical protein